MTLGSGPWEEPVGCVGWGNGLREGEENSQDPLEGVECSVLRFVAGPGLGSQREGSHWRQRLVCLPSWTGPSLLSTAGGGGLCTSTSSHAEWSVCFNGGQPGLACLATAPPGSPGAFPRRPACTGPAAFRTR